MTVPTAIDTLTMAADPFHALKEASLEQTVRFRHAQKRERRDADTKSCVRVAALLPLIAVYSVVLKINIIQIPPWREASR